ncbi:MAG TPA: hypothetical protein VIC71_14630 [Gammaproteobacteria bacterium]|jgi:hypothetical protein
MRAAAFVLCLLALPARAEWFVDLGLGANRLESKFALQDEWIGETNGSAHVGIGVRRAAGEKSDIGARLELDDVDSNLYIAIRAVDYRRHVSENMAVGFFLGAARLDLETPAYGYYWGGGVTLKELLRDWDFGVELRSGDNLARDNLLPSDPQGGSPDNFHDVLSLTLYLSRSF